MGATMGKNGGNILDSLSTTQGVLHIVMLGLDSAGKTTALYRLKFDQYLNTVPTIGFNCEKVRGTIGKAKGVQFLVWDVGGQEKLRPLWRSYTRCTDGIVFVVDSVDVERMEEAKMELLRTVKCLDNQGVPVLLLANKQDLPGAREPKELEKLLSLHDLSTQYVGVQNTFTQSISISPSNTSSAFQQTTEQQSKKYSFPEQNLSMSLSGSVCKTGISSNTICNSKKLSSSMMKLHQHDENVSLNKSSNSNTSSKTQLNKKISSEIKNDVIRSTDQQILIESSKESKNFSSDTLHSNNTYNNFKGWYIQPACAITGEGLQEGLDALYDMISKKRKINKTNKKKR